MINKFILIACSSLPTSIGISSYASSLNNNAYINPDQESKTDLSLFDDKDYSIHQISYNEDWESTIYLQISQYFGNLGMYEEAELFRNIHYYQSMFLIYGNNFSEPNTGKYIKYNLYIKALDNNVFYKGTTTFSLKLWNDTYPIDIVKEYQYIIDSQSFKEGFKVIWIDKDQPLNELFLSSFVLYVKDNYFNHLADPEILLDAWKNGELKIENNIKVDNDFYSIVDFNLKTKKSQNSNLLEPNKELKINNIEIIKRDKTSFSELQSQISNQTFYNYKIDKNNYNKEFIKDENTRILNDYFNKNPNNTIYSEIGNFLVLYKNYYSIEVNTNYEYIGQGDYGYFKVKRRYTYIPKKDNKIFKDNSVLAVDFNYELPYDDNVTYNIYSKWESLNWYVHWSGRIDKITDPIYSKISYSNLPGINSFAKLKQNYKYVELYIDGYAKLEGSTTDRLDYYNKEAGKVKIPLEDIKSNFSTTYKFKYLSNTPRKTNRYNIGVKTQIKVDESTNQLEFKTIGEMYLKKDGSKKLIGRLNFSVWKAVLIKK